MDKIAWEIEKLAEIIDEDIDCFIKRIDFIRGGDFGKVRFIDEKIMPNIHQKQTRQLGKIERMFSQCLGGKNVKD